MKNSKRHFALTHYQSCLESKQFKLKTSNPFKNVAQIQQKATSAQLGYIREPRHQRKFESIKNVSSIEAMVSTKECSKQNTRRISPTRNRSSKSFLTHQEFRPSQYVEREHSFDTLFRKSSQTGFYNKPHKSFSEMRLKENTQSRRVLQPQILYENNRQRTIEKNPITGQGMKYKIEGIKCAKQSSQMDQILYQNRDFFGKKIWDI